jgi:hypothetical protein
MDRLTFSKGFMLAEMCIVLIAVVSLTLIYLPASDFKNAESYTFGDSYLMTQSDAIVHAQRTSLDDPEVNVVFNQKGNVDQAMTISKGNKTIVIELGGGRIVYQP